MISLKSVYASSPSTAILHGVDLCIEPGTIHALMGPNGSGKSTLAHVLMGNPEYQLLDGSIEYDGVAIGSWLPDERSRKGIFLAFQDPVALSGVSARALLREAYRLKMADEFTLEKFNASIASACHKIGLDVGMLERSCNDGFSGGEKKRLEMVQLLVLTPQLAILDELDSGLDADGLKLMCDAIFYARSSNPTMSFLLITHYSRLLELLQPDKVHIMAGGKIIATGGTELASLIESEGYRMYTGSERIAAHGI